MSPSFSLPYLPVLHHNVYLSCLIKYHIAPYVGVDLITFTKVHNQLELQKACLVLN